MAFMRRVVLIVLIVGCLGLLASACACAPRSQAAKSSGVRPPADPDPLVAAAVKFAHGTSGRIVGYSVDYVVTLRTNLRGHVPPGTKTAVLLTVMNDGSVWWAQHLTPSWYPFGPKPPARLQPEPASSQAARDAALEAAHLRIVRGDRLLVGAVPLILGYDVRVRVKPGVEETVGVSPDGTQVGILNESVLRPWPPKP